MGGGGYILCDGAYILGGGGWWQIYFKWRWVVVGIFWVMVGGDAYILGGGGWW